MLTPRVSETFVNVQVWLGDSDVTAKQPKARENETKILKGAQDPTCFKYLRKSFKHSVPFSQVVIHLPQRNAKGL